MHVIDMMAVAVVPLLFLGILAAYAMGRRMGQAHLARNPEGAEEEGHVIDGAMFALLGLLVAFTFSGAAQRFDARRALIVEEANAISTAYLRLDLLPAAAQPELRADFRRYVDVRLAYYHSLEEPAAAARLKRDAGALQRSIWTRAVAAAEETHMPAPMMQITSALNAMIDITATRAMSLITHPPPVVYLMLVLVSLICGLLAGFASARVARPSRFHALGFASVVTLTIYVTADLEFPRYGLIRVDAADELLVEARRGME